MASLEEYGPLLRAAFAALHGGHPDEPPPRLRRVHEALCHLVAAAMEADQAMAQQVEAYNRGDLEASLRHSERVGQLVAESIRLDRDLILALRAAEEARCGTLAAPGLAEMLPPSDGAET